jgi:predicted DCC family thiol-disulfide oxidoreductase YuxK
MWRWTLIYDGQCKFCQRQVERALRWDADRRIEAVPFQTADLGRYGVSRDAAKDAIHLIGPSGTVWSGAAAARELSRLLPMTRPLSWLWAVPGAMAVAERTYRTVARRRHRFGCESDACRRGAA